VKLERPEAGKRDVLTVWRRQIELPRHFRAVEGTPELIRVLGEVVDELGFARLCVVSGPTVTLAIASEVADGVEAATGPPLLIEENSERQVELLAAARELRDADAVVAVGGGRTIDVAKLCCEQACLPLIVVPTQLTADGIASPVSVVQSASGAVESRHARLPIGIVVDMDVIASAPAESARAGLGDLLANACALRDWRRAEEAGRETVDDFAALLAVAGSDLACSGEVRSLAAGPPDRGFLERLLHGLVLSGLAMEVAGSSRPCSGSEHLVSHALDRLYPGTARHGEQVAFGTLLCTRLQGEDWRAVKRLMIEAGMQSAAAGFGLSNEQIVSALRAAPATRPGRYTVLDDVELSGRFLEPLVAEVLQG
jgi:glycerol-1-phosphate dehydrogenase [NAD(P)+]